MSRHSKRNVLLGIGCGALLTLASWTQIWINFSVSEGATTTVLAVPGTSASPLISAIALGSLAAVGALLIARRVARIIVLGAVLILGMGGVVTLLVTFANPVSASLIVLSATLGLSDIQTVSASVVETSITLWLWLAVVGFLVVCCCATWGLVSEPKWASPTDRFTRPEINASSQATTSSKSRAIDAWDSLSRGDDPTS